MVYDDLCFGCMQSKNHNEPICPYCGYDHSSLPESPLYLPPGTILEKKYLLGRVLGQGGFGITYLAYDLNLKVKLAIKEYFPQDLASRAASHAEVSAYTGNLGDQYTYGLDKFLQEARTLAQFEEHPNIVSVRDFFKANGTAYFVMSYVEGITLKELLKESGGHLTVDKARSILMPIMDALREVHAVNVLHRDISPDNIFLNLKGQVILIDFGAARQAIGEKGQSLSIILKPGYAPEEQYRSRGKQGPWTDIYALAATYYHMLTGQHPPESLERMVEDDLVFPRAMGITIDEWEEQALLKALAVRAADRYQMINDFQAGLTGVEPVQPVALVSRPAAASLGYAVETSTDSGAESAAAKTLKFPMKLPIVIGSSLAICLLMVALWLGGIFGEGSDGTVEESAGLDNDTSLMELEGNISGNSAGNLQNSGLAALQEDTVYFRSSRGGSISGGEIGSAETRMIGTDSAWYINVSGDWIYYCNRDDNDRVYRIGTDGTGRAPITRSRALFLNLDQEMLFYIDRDDEDRPYRSTVSGADRVRLSDDSAASLSVDGEYIYYLNSSDLNRLYRVKADGSSRERLTESAVCCPIAVKGILYYVNINDYNRLYRLKPGEAEIMLSDQSIATINFSDEWLYYTVPAENHALYKVSVGGGSLTMVHRGPVYQPNIVGDWIVYLEREDGDNLYRMKVDGSRQGLIESGFR